MPGCHTQTHTMAHTHTLSGKQSQRHGVTETKPQKRRLALCDNPLTHIYIQGLACGSVPPSPLPRCSRLPPPCLRAAIPLLLSFTPFNLYSSLSIFHVTRNSLPGPISGGNMALHDIAHRLASARFSLDIRDFFRRAKSCFRTD